MFPATFLGTLISTTTVPGAKSPITVLCGIPVTLTSAGRRTASVIGIGLARGAGAGLTLNPGALLPSTTAAGIISLAGGAGAQELIMGIRFMALLSLDSLVAEALGSVSAADSALAAALAGSHWVLASPSSPDSVAAGPSSTTSTSEIRRSITGISSTRQTRATSISSTPTIPPQ